MSEGRPYGFEVVRLAHIEARLVAYDWAWVRDNAERIAENWRRRLALQPGLFDGPVLLACGCAIADGTCQVDFFETRYAAFIAYRDGGSPDGHVANAFAAVVPWSADGAVLLGQMGGHTANAGQIYFPCGTPDRDDVRGTVVDLAGSAVRELREETGLALPGDVADAMAGEWALLRGDGQLAFLYPARFPESAEALAARMERHRLAEREPELERVVTVRGQDAIDAGRMPPFVRAYLASAFDADAAAADVTP
ncbi:NUDIX hydrolase [Methylobacterium radiodurans]|uniref:NUDIX hydrolase n=1 Tax=Methylobacterium radiodurans TaxID=2202828 RepID=A0A2U8VRS4_9HYPH|nr:NUDIX hydrolase [Methylobacterium radiodurans]AWN36160.1 NUDIX hydrolase [Methylobacterium radiodurans]